MLRTMQQITPRRKQARIHGVCVCGGGDVYPTCPPLQPQARAKLNLLSNPEVLVIGQNHSIILVSFTHFP